MDLRMTTLDNGVRAVVRNRPSGPAKTAGSGFAAGQLAFAQRGFEASTILAGVLERMEALRDAGALLPDTQSFARKWKETV